MSKGAAVSIRQRLLNLARERGEDFDYVLRQFVIQRLLYRLSQSDYREQYLLKGAQLFWIWYEAFHRPTRDIDLLGFANNDVGTTVKTFQEICGMQAEDGLRFDIDTIRGEEITEDAMYQGIRITGFAELAGARIPFQVDIGFGDAVTPAPEMIRMPSFLDMPVPELRAYPVYTVLAEKFQAMVYLGLANSRMKDFYDIRFLAARMDLEGKLFAEAVKVTFARRESAIVDEPLMIFEQDFVIDSGKNTQWNAFIKKNKLDEEYTFSETMQKLQIFLEPVYLTIAQGRTFLLKWSGEDWEWKVE